MKIICENCKHWGGPSWAEPYGQCRRVAPMHQGADACFRVDEDGEEYLRSDAPSAAFSGDAGFYTKPTHCCIMHEPRGPL